MYIRLNERANHKVAASGHLAAGAVAGHRLKPTGRDTTTLVVPVQRCAEKGPVVNLAVETTKRERLKCGLGHHEHNSLAQENQKPQPRHAWMLFLPRDSYRRQPGPPPPPLLDTAD